MTAHPDIFEAALALPLDERPKLVHELIERLEDEPYDDPEVVQAEHNAQIVRRAPPHRIRRGRGHSLRRGP